MDTAIVIYDGDCGICNESRAWAEARDRAERIDFLPFQTADLGAISPGLTREMAGRMAYFVCPDGSRHGGARAVFETLKRLPGVWGIIGRVGANPVISSVVEPFYRVFAANRHRVSAWLGLAVCRVPPRQLKAKQDRRTTDNTAGHRQKDSEGYVSLALWRQAPQRASSAS
jgi:predicted DCC family thiol-disulfide oxidoreductase YuxK